MKGMYIHYLPLWHSKHSCFMPKCLILLCLYRALWLENILSHVLHLIRFREAAGKCRYEWAFRSLTVFPHSSHICFAVLDALSGLTLVTAFNLFLLLSGSNRQNMHIFVSILKFLQTNVLIWGDCLYTFEWCF